MDTIMKDMTSKEKIQCDVVKVSLYTFPSNLVRLESCDFEQCILQCIKNRLDENPITTIGIPPEEEGLSKRMIQEIRIKSDLNLCQNNENHDDEPLDYCVAVCRNKLIWTAGKNLNSGEDLIQECHLTMQSEFDEIKLCYVTNQMPTVLIWLLNSMPKRVVKNEFLVSKYCYYKSHHSESPPTDMIAHQNPQVSKDLQPNINVSNSMFALVWRCHDEQDVVHLRETYKYLQSLKRINQTDFIQQPSSNGVDPRHQQHHHHLISQNKSRVDADETIATTTPIAIQSAVDCCPMLFGIESSSSYVISNSSPSAMNTLDTKTTAQQQKHSNIQQEHHQMLARQRQPAKIILEEEENGTKQSSRKIKERQQQPVKKNGNFVNLKNYLQQQPPAEPKSSEFSKKKLPPLPPVSFNLYKYVVNRSEFDTTQINQLYQASGSTGKSNIRKYSSKRGNNGSNGHSRSRSVDAGAGHHRRTRTYEMQIGPVDDDYDGGGHRHHVSSVNNNNNNNGYQFSHHKSCSKWTPSSSNNNNNVIARSFVDLHLNSEGSSMSDDYESSSDSTNSFGDSESPPSSTAKSNELNNNNKKSILVVKSVLKKPGTTTTTNSSSSPSSPSVIEKPPATTEDVSPVGTAMLTRTHHFLSSASALLLGERLKFSRKGVVGSPGSSARSSSTSAAACNCNQSSNSSHGPNHGKKNVTFSAYATIQVVDT